MIRGKNVDFVGAPVSGGESRALDAMLSFMVGGEVAVIERVKSYARTMERDLRIITI